MEAQCGSAIILNLKDAGGVSQAVAGLRNKRLTMNAEAVDVTNSDSVGRWREYLDGCGVRSMDISGDGVFLDDLGAAVAVDMHMSNSIRNASVFIPGLGTFEGKFKLTQCEFSAPYNDGVTYSVSLASAGVITFTGA